MSNMKLSEALITLESELGLEAPLGIGKLPLAERFAAVLAHIREILCPRKEAILSQVKREEAALTVVVSDVLISYFSGALAPVATISREIAVLGLEKFCARPSRLFEDRQT